ncbi:unnamed protein product, partial [Amoebophrya sp. A120]
STSSSQPLELCQDGALVDPPSYYTNSRNRAAKLKAFADAKNLAQQLYARAKADNIWFHFVKNEAREGGLCHSDQLKVPDSEEDKSVLAAIEQVATEQADRETGKDFSYDKDFYGSLGLFANAGKHIDDCRTEWPTDEAGRFVERRVRVYQKQREVLKNYAKRYHGGDWTPTHFELDNCGNHVAHWLVHRYTTFPTVCDKLKTHGNSLVQAEKDKEKQGQVDALLQVDKNGNSKLHRAIFQGDVTRAKRLQLGRPLEIILANFLRIYRGKTRSAAWALVSGLGFCVANASMTPRSYSASFWCPDEEGQNQQNLSAPGALVCARVLGPVAALMCPT